MDRKHKIGFSQVGGIYIGQGIQSTFHKHYVISVILSFGAPFSITTLDHQEDTYQVAVIQKNTSYKLHSHEDTLLAFLHIVPHSTLGSELSNKHRPIQKHPIEPFHPVLEELTQWLAQTENQGEDVEQLLSAVVQAVPKQANEPIAMDERVQQALSLIDQSDAESLPIDEIARAVSLSPSHFARLLKKETGLTFREYVLQSKLVKSIYAMYKNKSLTEASFHGGFADQPHFSRTFKNAFGIMPSTSRK